MRSRRLVLLRTLAWSCALLGPIAPVSSIALAAESAPSKPAVATPADVQDLVFLGPMRPLVVRLHITVDGLPFRQPWKDRVENLWAQADADGAGHVKVEQAATIVREMQGSLRDAAESSDSSKKDPALTALAAADGTIDRGALTAYLEKTFPVFTLRRRAVVGRGSTLALFPLLDVDGNHQLSLAELNAAEERLSHRDFNDDRVITPAELILDPNAIAAAADPNATPADLDPTEGSVVLLDAAVTPDKLAERLLKHYDRNRDGRLTTAPPEIEIKLPPALLRLLDANGDAALERQELAALAERRPDIELFFALGRSTASESRTRPRAGDAEFRIRKTLLGGYDLKLGEAEVSFKRNNRDPEDADPAQFRTIDRDNNGYIDANEATAGNIGKANFAAMDDNSDGKVFKPEFTAYMRRQNAAAAARLQLEVSDLGQNLFDLLDTDMDGGLSPRELRAAKDVLASHDNNGDGLLNGDEIPQSFEFELLRGIDQRPEMANRGAARVTRFTATANSAGPTWFRKMDRNNDGDLSPYEFLGPRAAFDKLDANHDGLIDREEAEAAGK